MQTETFKEATIASRAVQRAENSENHGTNRGGFGNRPLN
jgi:hypothetical protein